MSAALSSSAYPFPRIVAETMLLRRFAVETGAYLKEEKALFENETYFLATAQVDNVAGFGRSPTRRMAHLKAIAEFYERRLMHEAFSSELSYVPKFLQTSNGFAVHFSEEDAQKAAIHEAIERHLLQYSFFKYGWNGFKLLHKKQIGKESLTFVTTRFSINGLCAGMVLATSKRFQGISFGYFVDQTNKIESSPRWSHAAHEAVDKIEPFLKLSKCRNLHPTPIEQGILNWMMLPSEKLAFSMSGAVRPLPSPTIEITTFDLSQRWGLDFPLFGAYCSSPELLPLIIVERFNKDDSDFILDLFKKFDLPLLVPERNPIL